MRVVGMFSTPRRDLWALGGLVALIVAVYAMTLSASLVYEDRLWTPPVFHGALLESVPSRTLSGWSLWGLDQTWGPPVHHGLNVLLHVVNTWLVWQMAGILTGRRTVAFWSAVVFGLHPIQVETVAYLSERTELLALTCALSAIVLGFGASWRRWPLVATLLWASLLSKEVSIVFLGVAPLAWLWPWRRLPWGAIGGLGAVAVLLTVPWIRPLVSTWQIWTLHANADRTAWGYAWLQTVALGCYLALIVWPVGFTVDHDFEIVPAAWQVISVSLVLAGIGWGTWRAWARHRIVVLAIWWPVLALWPRWITRSAEYLSEHQMYTPMVGISLLLGYGAACLTERI